MSEGGKRGVRASAWGACMHVGSPPPPPSSAPCLAHREEGVPRENKPCERSQDDQVTKGEASRAAKVGAQGRKVKKSGAGKREASKERRR